MIDAGTLYKNATKLAIPLHLRSELTPAVRKAWLLSLGDFVKNANSQYPGMVITAKVCIHVCMCKDRLAGLVVKASASGEEDPGFESCLRRDFNGSSHTSDLKLVIPVATLPGARHYRVSAGTGRPGVSIL